MDADIPFGAFYLDEIRVSGILDQEIGDILVHLPFHVLGIPQLRRSQLLLDPHLVDRDARLFAHFPERSFRDLFAALDLAFGRYPFDLAAERVPFDEEISWFSI